MGSEKTGDVAAEKAALRERFQAARRATAPGAQAAASAAVRERLLRLPEIAAAAAVHLFWPLLGRGEVDLRPLAAALRERGVTVALPVVASGPGEPPRLVHRAFEGAGRLVPGRWGLSEPAADAAAVDVCRLDVVVVPALAADRRGTRLGYGGGFYDGFLRQTPAFRVGVVPDEAFVDHLPSDRHDVALDAVVTPSRTVRVEPARRNPPASAP